ncbi:hypothetical protein BGLT_06577 [Caballeronia glathei]|uniref:Uncharacterized protein n=1 Tax=Caballeronia glathei TaxID=60547 RepID=A0A069PBH8_9BURK|nr:hypothetical protein BG61_04570 [Caballeronia glathei]CDY77772.1 hypothetical protein BGLT_06577 [Caballeronia glathei]
MKCMKAVAPRAVCGLPIAEAVPAQATEGGIGRPITGMEVTPYAAVVPPTSGCAGRTNAKRTPGPGATPFSRPSARRTSEKPRAPR